MSKVNPMQTSASASSIDQLQVKCKPTKKRRKSDRLRLPTPPPDPTLCPPTPTPGSASEGEAKSAKDKEAEFLEYLETLQKSPLIMGTRTGTSFAPAEVTEAAITHLDKLYKLMGQMLTLREQNILLHRRIMDLERFRSMQCMDKQLELIAKLDTVPADDYDTTNAENILYNILTESKKESKKVQTKFQKSMLRKSAKLRSFDADGTGVRRISMPFSTYSDKQAKVSKWTKVKAAFRWEKASPTVSDAKSQDSGLGLAQPVNYEVARYLRVPSTSEDAGISPADSGAAEASTPATLSSASSAEELHRHHHAQRRTHEDTSDDDQLFMYEYIPCSAKDEASTSKGQGCSKHKTPWAKVKDIIQTQTRNSFKIRHRLSAKSDDFKMDDSITVDSENEEVFDVDEPKSPILIIQSPEEISLENEALSLEHSIPIDIIARYRIINEECAGSLESKWEKVKRAFLHSPSTSKNDSSSPTTPEPYSKNDLLGVKNETKIQAEIQRNYLQLQKKLSLEFQEKLQEWERTKIRAASTSALSTSPHSSALDDSKEQAFKKKMEEWQKIKGQPKHNLQLQSEENLPPEFRKKLEKWKRIKKASIREDKRKPPELPKWKSFGSPKTDLENQQLSEDFLKKYETWKQIKAGIITPEEYERLQVKGSKSPSPKLLRKDGSQKKLKDSAEKELQWLDKGIEREKQRLERDKQKFLDREQRLSKLRRSVIGQNKKEILVHLPSGFYRFEGISRKFTQKLYEWEKARGIGPEESTFTLLKSSCIPHIEPKSKFPQRQLKRSKSADSVMNEPLGPMLSQRPSSLSLNELDNLEEEILLPDIIRSGETNDNEQEINEEENEEPEAVIVEVEDVVEETASVMPTFAEKHFAVYQKQETDKLCTGELVGPTVRRSESARAQANYNLIEEIIEVLKKLACNENEIDDVERAKSIIDLHELADDEEVRGLKCTQEQQKHLSEVMIEKLVQLQEANSNVAVSIAREEPKYKMAKLVDVLDTIQDLTTELLTLAESIDHFIYKRNKNQLEYGGIVASRNTYPQIGENLNCMKEKILELRRYLSYICAASDIAVAAFKRKEERPLLRKSSSRESKRGAFKKSRSKDSQELDDATNSPTLSRQIEQGAVKKRLRYRQKGMQTKTFDESDDDDDEIALQEQRKAKPRRVRSQNSTESNKSLPKNGDCASPPEGKDDTKDDIVVDPSVIEKVLIPTKPAFMSSFEDLTPPHDDKETDSPVTVFVKTTRKLFTPIASAGTGPGTSSGTKSTDDDRTSRASVSISSLTSTSSSSVFQHCVAGTDSHSAGENVSHLPPIPASPTLQRKLPKEISPNIRLMMVRYNQKITEDSGVRSGGSSGSASPVAWRSPVLERRVKAQTEKYQQELQKMSPLLGGRREVQKSASMDVVISGNKQVTVHKMYINNPKGILKSSSASVIKPSASQAATQTKPSSSPIPETEDVKTSSDARSLKLQKAKEEFLKGVTTPTVNDAAKSNGEQVDRRKEVPNTSEDMSITSQKQLRYPTKNRLSQVSVGSDISCSSPSYGMLIKSASVGMINVDLATYNQLYPGVHEGGCASLPRSGSSKKNLLSNLTSKFRKVKMRRNKDRDKDKSNEKDKDKDKMNAVSTLCRQSLLVDIQNSSQETLSEDQSRLSIPSDSKGSSTDTSPSTSRTSSWIKRSKIFATKKP